MLMWIVKKFVLGKINALLKDHQEDIDKVKDTLNIWISRVEKILTYLKSLLNKVDDGTLDPDEIDEAVSEAKKLVEEW